MLPGIALLSPRLIIVAAVAIALAGSHWSAYRHGKQTVRTEWQADTAQRTAEALLAEQAARKREADLQANANKIRSAKNAEIHSLTVRVGEYARRLQDRADRPAGGDVSATPGLGGSPAGCTGAGLFKRDGEFLTGLAADADRLRLALGACQSQYRALVAPD